MYSVWSIILSCRSSWFLLLDIKSFLFFQLYTEQKNIGKNSWKKGVCGGCFSYKFMRTDQR